MQRNYNGFYKVSVFLVLLINNKRVTHTHTHIWVKLGMKSDWM